VIGPIDFGRPFPTSLSGIFDWGVEAILIILNHEYAQMSYSGSISVTNYSVAQGLEIARLCALNFFHTYQNGSC
jgi:hypothetical protein